MKGLYGLWKTNLAVVVLQTLVGTGLWFDAVNSPKISTVAENLLFVLVYLLLITIIGGLIAVYPMVSSKDKKDAIPGYILWISVFALFGAVCAVLASSFLALADAYHLFNAGWEAGGIIFFRILIDTVTIVFVIVWYGGMFAFFGIWSFVSILKMAEDEEAPRLIYGVAALPFGVGVLGGGAFFLLRKLLSSR